jgi:hypothetical protein
MNSKRFFLILFSLLFLPIITIAHFQDSPEKAAQKAAEDWLKLIDNGNSLESWNQASQLFRAEYTKPMWEEVISTREVIFPLHFRSRQLKEVNFVKSLVKVPGQEGVFLSYESSIANQHLIIERLELVLEKNQVWKVANYGMERKGSVTLPITGIPIAEPPSLAPVAPPMPSTPPIVSTALNSTQIGNKTKAIEVVKAERIDRIYRLTLKNTSAKPIFALEVYFPTGEASSGTKEYVAVKPGGIHEMNFFISGLELRERQSKVPEGTLLPKLVVGWVIFEDWTFEGDREPVLIIMAKWRVSIPQSARLLNLLQDSIEKTEAGGSNVLENLRQQLSVVSDESNLEIVNEMSGRFGSFASEYRNELMREMREACRSINQEVIEETKVYEKYEAQKGVSLLRWLTDLKKNMNWR